MSIISSFQVFTPAYIIGGGISAGGGMGGPDNAGLFYMLYLYKKAFSLRQMGFASSMAWVGGVIVFTLTLVLNMSQKKWVYYGTELAGGARL